MLYNILVITNFLPTTTEDADISLLFMCSQYLYCRWISLGQRCTTLYSNRPLHRHCRRLRKEAVGDADIRRSLCCPPDSHGGSSWCCRESWYTVCHILLTVYTDVQEILRTSCGTHLQSSVRVDSRYIHSGYSQYFEQRAGNNRNRSVLCLLYNLLLQPYNIWLATSGQVYSQGEIISSNHVLLSLKEFLLKIISKVRKIWQYITQWTLSF